MRRPARLAFVFLLASAVPSKANRDTDVAARAFPACAELREVMQAECWTPLAVLNARGEPLVEGSPLDRRCDAIFRAALVACPSWPRTPRTSGWRAFYRRIRKGWEPPITPLEGPGCFDPESCG